MQFPKARSRDEHYKHKLFNECQLVQKFKFKAQREEDNANTENDKNGGPHQKSNPCITGVKIKEGARRWSLGSSYGKLLSGFLSRVLGMTIP